MKQAQGRGLKSITLLCDSIDRDRVYSVENWDDEDEDGDVLEHQEEEHDNDRP